MKEKDEDVVFLQKLYKLSVYIIMSIVITTIIYIWVEGNIAWVCGKLIITEIIALFVTWFLIYGGKETIKEKNKNSEK